MDNTGSYVIQIRVAMQIKKKAEAQAMEKGHIKPNGDPNVSEYVKQLILDDLNKK